MSVLEVMVAVVAVLVTMSRVETVSRASPEQPCYYQPYYKQLTCSCSSQETSPSNTFLGLNMIHFVRNLGQEVRKQSTEQSLISHTECH